MRNILLPTDFSENAWNAIVFALNMFKDQVCTFYILHTYTPAFYRMDYLIGGPSFSAIPDVGVEKALAGLENTKADIERDFPNDKHSFKTLSAFSMLTDEINEISEKKKIDMVIMGTKGATGAKEIFMGTNAVYVIRKALVPVLVVPEGVQSKEIKKILFATDYWSKYKEEEFSVLTDLAKMYGAEITVLHVKEEYDLSEEQLDNKDLLDENLRDIAHAFDELKGGLMPDAIMNYIAEDGFDLLIMMNRRHSLLAELLWPQNVERIGFQVKIPFLVIRDTARVLV